MPSTRKSATVEVESPQVAVKPQDESPKKQTNEMEGTTTPIRMTTESEQPRKDSEPLNKETSINTVTPPDVISIKEESPVAADANEKQVRFGGASSPNESAQTDSDATPKAATTNNNNSREQPPQRNSGRRGRYAAAKKQTHPGENSGGAVLEFKTYRSPPRKKDEEVPSLCSSSSDAPAQKRSKSAIPTKSISVDPSQDTTSPLATHDAEKTDKPTGKSEDAESESARSPKPSEHIGSMYADGNLQSPGNFLLSPNPPTPTRGPLRSSPSFEEKKSDGEEKAECKPSPRTDREHIVATPTNFAIDYGKQVTESFDTSNVLAWLQSPTAHGLFSPGGYGSMTNTPAAGGSRTPRTPTVSTSFFFSDVASLPRNEMGSPKPAENEKKSNKGGISNIICISPLASSRNRTGGTPSGSTPMNFKDFFASPRERARALPLLNDNGDTPKAGRLKVPQRSGSKDPSLDAVHLAERDLMEDEDLSVLLQLASNTPRPGERGQGPSVGPVFRSPGRRKEGDESNLPALQIPMIGNGRDNETKARLTQKSSRSRDHDAESRLGVRSSSAGQDDDKEGKSGKSKDEGSLKPSASGPSPGSLYGVPPAYRADMPHYYPPVPSMPPGVPPGSRSGSMRVVVGVPRDGKNGSPGRPGPGGPHGPGYPHDYPPPPNGMPFAPGPPHGMYPGYGPYPGMGRYPPYGHYAPPPPPRHMPMYNAQHPVGGASKDAATKSKAKPVKTTSGNNKRSSPLLDTKNTSSNKKLKKTSPQKKPKNRSPQPESGGERQKSAAAVQAVNAASGGKNDRAAALAAAILRGVTMRPSGKWQAQLYFAGKSRYIGVFDTREKAALAYEIAREKLKSGPQDGGPLTPKSTENLVNAARKAAFEGVNDRAPK